MNYNFLSAIVSALQCTYANWRGIQGRQSKMLFSKVEGDKELVNSQIVKFCFCINTSSLSLCILLQLNILWCKLEVLKPGLFSIYLIQQLFKYIQTNCFRHNNPPRSQSKVGVLVGEFARNCIHPTYTILARFVRDIYFSKLHDKKNNIAILNYRSV